MIILSAIFNRVLFTKACQDIASAIFGYNNWWQIFNGVSYFENAGIPSPYTHFWSLAIEIQFYLLFPLLILFLSRFKKSRKVTFITLAVMSAVSAVLMMALFNTSTDPSRTYYGTDTRLFSLLFGAMLAMKEKKLKKSHLISPIIRNIMGIASFAALFVMMITINGYSLFYFRGGQVLVSALVVIIIYSMMLEDSVLALLFEAAPLKWIGEHSYGIYVWHYPIILLICGTLNVNAWQAVIVFLITFACAYLSRRFIETPVINGAVKENISVLISHPRGTKARRRQLRAQKVCGSVAVICVACVLCMALVPKQSALANINELEAQAEIAQETAAQKAAQLVADNDDASADTSEPTETAVTVTAEPTGTEESAEVSQTVTPTETATPTPDASQTDEEFLASLNLLLIGDSISLGAYDEFYAVFQNSIMDSAVSRYTTESFDLYTSYADGGWDGDGVVFALGSNGLLYDSLPTLREMIGTDRPFFIYTSVAPGTEWADDNNAEVYQFVQDTPNTYLVDWKAASEGHPEYFDGDGTHVNSEGANAYIECLKQAVLSALRD